MSIAVTEHPPDLSPPSRWERTRQEARDYLAHVRLFSRNAWLYLFGLFLIGVNFEIFQLLLNLYLKEIGLAEGHIGLVNSSRAVGLTLMALPAAVLLGRIQLKPVLICAGIAFAVFAFGLASAHAFNVIIAFSVLMGMAFTFSRVAAGPFYMRNSTPKERTHLFSFSFGVMLLAGMAGSQIGGRLVSVMASLAGDVVNGYRYTLYVAIAIGLLSLVPFSLLRKSATGNEETRINLSREQFKRRGGFYFKMAFANFLIGLGAGLIIPFLNLYFRDKFGLSPATIGSFYFCTVLAMFIGTMSGPLLARRFGLVRTIVFTQLASIPFMLLLGYTVSTGAAFFAYVLRACLMNIGVPIATNVSMELSEDGERGLVNALLMVSWNGSWMVSTAVGGNLIEHYGYALTFVVTSVLYVISTLFYFWAFRGVERRDERANRWSILKAEGA
jgi:predicted MFS family arabinose efflux permease